MKTQVLTGSKAEIAAAVARIDGEIREVIAIIEEPTNSTPQPPAEDIFAEMEPFTVKAGALITRAKHSIRP
jgi:hypothetical protein